MPDLTLDDIRNYVQERGPKRVKNYHGATGCLDYVLDKLMGPGRSWSREDIPARIQEILPENGRVLLSGENSKIIIYDPNTHSYREAAWDISEGQLVPTERSFNLNGEQQTTQLTVYKFTNTPYHFLSKALGLFQAPVIEVGRHEGDNGNRYFAMRLLN